MSKNSYATEIPCFGLIWEGGVADSFIQGMSRQLNTDNQYGRLTRLGQSVLQIEHVEGALNV